MFRMLREDEGCSSLSIEERLSVLKLLREAGQLARIENLISAREVPAEVQSILVGARNAKENNCRRIRWEVNRITRVLASRKSPVMLLKGAAYLALEIPMMEFRPVSDVDVLVNLDDIPVMVALLKAHGWLSAQLSAYDESYYLDWMHEIPPMRHSARGIPIDIHHALLPRTSRLQPDTEKVWERAVQLPDSPLLVPCPEDMVLHCAFHAYHQGEFDNAPRDVIDMFDLLSHFTRDDPGFWGRLVDRAVEIGVVPPLWHALSVTQFIFDIGPPVDVQAKLDSLFPRTWSRDFVQRLIRRVTSYPVQTDSKAARAQQLLHARSHYLRMPLPILARHLATKSYYNWQRSREAAKAQKAHLEQFKQ